MQKVYCNNCGKVKPADGSSTMLAPNWADGVWLVCRNCRIKLGLLKPPKPRRRTTDEFADDFSSPFIGFGRYKGHHPARAQKVYPKKRKGG